MALASILTEAWSNRAEINTHKLQPWPVQENSVTLEMAILSSESGQDDMPSIHVSELPVWTSA